MPSKVSGDDQRIKILILIFALDSVCMLLNSPMRSIKRRQSVFYLAAVAAPKCSLLAKARKLIHGYHLGRQTLVVIFDLLDVCSLQLGMITIADW